MIPGLLGSFRKLFPQIEIVLFEGEQDEIATWLSGSVVDVGFTTLPVSDMHTFPLTEDELLLFVPQEHSLVGEKHVTFAQIKDKCFIMPKDNCFKKLLHEHGWVPNVTYEVRDAATILTMVQEWIGVTILPELSIPDMLPKVTGIPLQPRITRELVLAVRDYQSISPVTAEFILHSQNYWRERKRHPDPGARYLKR